MHPSCVKGQGRSKEGFSLLSLLDRTRSLLGRRLLKQWMLKPSTNLKELACRHDAVECLMCGTSQGYREGVTKQLKLMKDAPRNLQRIKTVTGNYRGDSATHYRIATHVLTLNPPRLDFSAHNCPGHALDPAIDCGDAA